MSTSRLQPEISEFRDRLQSCEEYEDALNEWETSFVASNLSQIKRLGNLFDITDAREEALSKIERKLAL